MAVTSLKEDFQNSIDFIEYLAIPLGGVAGVTGTLGGIIGLSATSTLGGAFAGAAIGVGLPVAFAGVAAAGCYAGFKAVQYAKSLAGYG